MKRNTTARWNPKEFCISSKKYTSELESLVHDPEVGWIDWQMTSYLKINPPTASSSDPCQSDLDHWWELKFLLISSVEILNVEEISNFSIKCILINSKIKILH